MVAPMGQNHPQKKLPRTNTRNKTPKAGIILRMTSFFKHPKTGKPFKPEEIQFVKNAYDLGLGQINLSKVRAKKVTAA